MLELIPMTYTLCGEHSTVPRLVVTKPFCYSVIALKVVWLLFAMPDSIPVAVL